MTTRERYFVIQGEFKKTIFMRQKQLFIFLMLVAGVVLIGDYFFLKGATPSGTIRHISSNDNVTGWKTYRNIDFGFKFQYPPEWKIS